MSSMHQFNPINREKFLQLSDLKNQRKKYVDLKDKIGLQVEDLKKYTKWILKSNSPEERQKFLSMLSERIEVREARWAACADSGVLVFNLHLFKEIENIVLDDAISIGEREKKINALVKPVIEYLSKEKSEIKALIPAKIKKTDVSTD